MGIFDYFKGGNILVAAKSTVKIFLEGMSMFGSYDRAYRYTYIFRNNTVTRYVKHQRDFLVSKMFQEGAIVNCTYITVANLNTGAAPKDILFYETFHSFHEEISGYLRKYGIPEQYVSGNNRECIAHIANFLCRMPVVPPEMRDALILHE
ncbi:MAG: hypothetical protein LBT40_15690 [Deltaproteobacteria bacterium]|jgi:hypothetical protein|nr:hypothetical protein [Deltaproteobacteria bacterium]